MGTFRPLDVFPCVVDEENWSEQMNMGALFGDLCKGNTFAHDEAMKAYFLEQQGRPAKRKRTEQHTQNSQNSERSADDEDNMTPAVTAAEQSSTNAALEAGPADRAEQQNLEQPPIQSEDDRIFFHCADSSSENDSDFAPKSALKAALKAASKETASQPPPRQDDPQLPTRCLWDGCTLAFKADWELALHLQEDHCDKVLLRGEDAWVCQWDGCVWSEMNYFRSEDECQIHVMRHSTYWDTSSSDDDEDPMPRRRRGRQSAKSRSKHGTEVTVGNPPPSRPSKPRSEVLEEDKYLLKNFNNTKRRRGMLPRRKVHLPTISAKALKSFTANQNPASKSSDDTDESNEWDTPPRGTSKPHKPTSPTAQNPPEKGENSLSQEFPSQSANSDITLSSAHFNSQSDDNELRDIGSIDRRRQAYRAARLVVGETASGTSLGPERAGDGGLAWGRIAPVTAGNNHSAEEEVLGERNE